MREELERAAAEEKRKMQEELEHKELEKRYKRMKDEEIEKMQDELYRKDVEERYRKMKEKEKAEGSCCGGFCGVIALIVLAAFACGAWIIY